MNQKNHILSNQTGAAAILVAVSLILVIGLAALSVDISRRVMVENEVQNAVDAGALAGARALILIDPTDNSTSVNEDANDEAIAAAVANSAARLPVSVVSVERGHWTFDIEGYNGEAAVGFTPDNSTADYNLDEATGESLNADPAWINAIRVTASTTGSVSNFFARIFGDTFATFNVVKDAVGYRGFAGRVPPDGVDLPISICAGAMEEDRCTIGRMFPDNDQTARWTDFTQEDTGGCGTASTGGVGELLDNCTGNPIGLNGGEGVSTTNGTVANLLDSFVDCFFRPGPNTPRLMNVTLPVVNCESSGNCRNVEGFINIDIVWVLRKTNPQDEDVPRELFKELEDGSFDRIWPPDGFVYPDNATKEDRWADFAEDFNLQLQDESEGRPPLFNPGGKTIYFLPNCELQDPLGGIGGDFYGILSEEPVLVE